MDFILINSLFGINWTQPLLINHIMHIHFLHFQIQFEEMEADLYKKGI